jgi:hypothetical protein
VAAHGWGLSGEFDEGIKQKTAALKNPRPQVIFQAIFYDPFDPLQWVGDIAHAMQNDALPNPDAFIIDRKPDFLLVAEVAVETPLGQAAGFHDASYGGIEVSLDREELHGFFYDIFAS